MNKVFLLSSSLPLTWTGDFSGWMFREASLDFPSWFWVIKYYLLTKKKKFTFIFIQHFPISYCLHSHFGYEKCFLHLIHVAHRTIQRMRTYLFHFIRTSICFLQHNNISLKIHSGGWNTLLHMISRTVHDCLVTA